MRSYGAKECCEHWIGCVFGKITRVLSFQRNNKFNYYCILKLPLEHSFSKTRWGHTALKNAVSIELIAYLERSLFRYLSKEAINPMITSFLSSRWSILFSKTRWGHTALKNAVSIAKWLPRPGTRHPTQQHLLLPQCRLTNVTTSRNTRSTSTSAEHRTLATVGAPTCP